MGTAQSLDDFDSRLIEWGRKNRRSAIVAGVVFALVVGGAWFWWTARERRELFADRALSAARSSAEAGNLPLASSDLARLIGTYGSTRAAEEASLLLSQVRLLQNQPALAVGDLRKFISAGPRTEFRGPANGLLGGALEESGQPGEAAKAYEAAADGTPYRGVKAQYLTDAARTYASAGDTAKAAKIYEDLIKNYKDQSSAVEAKVRLTEIKKSPLRPS